MKIRSTSQGALTRRSAPFDSRRGERVPAGSPRRSGDDNGTFRGGRTPSHLSACTSTPFLYERHHGSRIVRGTVLTDANLLRKGGNNTVAYFTTWLSAVLRKEEGQGLAEYALILALIAVVAILALVFLGGKISGILSNIGVNI